MFSLGIIAYLLIAAMVGRGWFTYWTARESPRKRKIRRFDEHSTHNADFCVLVGFFWVFIPVAIVIAALVNWVVYPVFSWLFKLTDYVVNRFLKPKEEA